MAHPTACPGCGWVRNARSAEVLCRGCKSPSESVTRQITEAVEAEARKRFAVAMVYLILSADMRRSA